MYSIAGYGSMIADHVRMRAYTEALKRSVHPGSVMVDLGAGTCVMSCLAAQFGAATVYAIEPAEALELGRVIVRANGMEDRIHCYRAVSEAVTLPQQADVVVADLRTVLPPFGNNFRAIADARRRFLKPGGILIPQRDILWAALVEAPEPYRELTGGWDWNHLELRAGRHMAVNRWIKRRVAPEQLLSHPAQWAEIDYRTVEEPGIAGEIHTEVARGGTAHGLCVWFDTVLLDGIGFSNAPDQPEAIYGEAFFPLQQPVSVEAGDSLFVSLRADLLADDYTWTWETRVSSKDGVAKAAYRQSTFFGTPFSADRLFRRAPDFVPGTAEEAAIDRAILERFGAGRNLREIAADVAALFPGRFADWKAAFGRVAALSDHYAG